jgi:hypothetical protein
VRVESCVFGGCASMFVTFFFAFGLDENPTKWNTALNRDTH